LLADFVKHVYVLGLQKMNVTLVQYSTYVHHADEQLSMVLYLPASAYSSVESLIY
jgi:hypothetical protein